MTRQDRAQQVVDELVGRLTDPQEVAATTVRRAEAVSDPGARAQAWKADSLARGYPGLTVLWAELGVDDDASRRRAHRYLEAATVACRTEGFTGMFDGLGALAGATRAAGHQNGDYRSLATKVDVHAVSYAMHLIAVHRAARQAGRPTVSSVVDAMYGLAGVGRHLLHRPEHHATVRDILSCLVSLDETFDWQGYRVPGWWYDTSAINDFGPDYHAGSVTFGLAHGLAGVIAVLAQAQERGVQVAGQKQALENMVGGLLEQREFDDAGAYWPAHLPLARWLEPPGRRKQRPLPARPSWCHGTPGVAMAVHRAAVTARRADWEQAAVESMKAMLLRPFGDWPMADDALCHGWSGVLFTVDTLARETGDTHLAVGRDRLVDIVLASFKPDTPFGYVYSRPVVGGEFDLPGLLEGTAGIALVLHAYATKSAPTTEWDTCFLLR